MSATFLLYYYIILDFSTNMTRFKNYSFLIEDRRVLNPTIFGFENLAWKLHFVLGEVLTPKILDSSTKCSIFFWVYSNKHYFDDFKGLYKSSDKLSLNILVFHRGHFSKVWKPGKTFGCVTWKSESKKCNLSIRQLGFVH